MDKKGGKHRESGFLVLHDQLTETRICFGLQFEGAACRRRESPAGRNARPLVTLHPPSGGREPWALRLSSLSPFYSVQDFSPRDGAAHIKNGSSFQPLVNSRESEPCALPGLHSGADHSDRGLGELAPWM